MHLPSIAYKALGKLFSYLLQLFNKKIHPSNGPPQWHKSQH